VAVIILWILLALSFGVFVMMLHQYLQERKSSRWPHVEGKVIESTVVDNFENSESEKAEFRPQVKYQYRVDGTDYTAEQFSYNRVVITRNEATSLVEQRYQPGHKVTVFYNPKHPEQAVLQPGLETKKIVFMALRYTAFLISTLFLISILSTPD